MHARLGRWLGCLTLGAAGASGASQTAAVLLQRRALAVQGTRAAPGVRIRFSLGRRPASAVCEGEADTGSAGLRASSSVFRFFPAEPAASGTPGTAARAGGGGGSSSSSSSSGDLPSQQILQGFSAAVCRCRRDAGQVGAEQLPDH